MVSEQNRVPFFSRRGALTHVCKTPPKRVLVPEPTTPCVRAAPQTVFSVFDPSKRPNDGAQKVLSTNNPILFRNTPGIPCPVLRFYKPPDFVHTAPDFVHTAPDFVQFCKTRGDTETDISPQPSTEDLSHNWQVADCDDCDAAAAALLTSWPTKIRRD